MLKMDRDEMVQVAKVVLRFNRYFRDTVDYAEAVDNMVASMESTAYRYMYEPTLASSERGRVSSFYGTGGWYLTAFDSANKEDRVIRATVMPSLFTDYLFESEGG